MSPPRAIAVLLTCLLPLLSASAENTVYYADSNTIFFDDGAITGEIQSSLLVEPAGLAVDLINDKLYWADKAGGASTGFIGRYDLSGSGSEVSVLSGLNDPEAIAVDPAADRIFWSEGYYTFGN